MYMHLFIKKFLYIYTINLPYLIPFYIKFKSQQEKNGKYKKEQKIFVQFCDKLI